MVWNSPPHYPTGGEEIKPVILELSARCICVTTQRGIALSANSWRVEWTQANEYDDVSEEARKALIMEKLTHVHLPARRLLNWVRAPLRARREATKALSVGKMRRLHSQVGTTDNDGLLDLYQAIRLGEIDRLIQRSRRAAQHSARKKATKK